MDVQHAKYSVHASSTRGIKPAGDGVTRLALEAEMLAIRAMRHVFRLKRNLSLQHWVTVLNPVLPRGYPPQLVLTLEQDLTEPTFESVGARDSPERQALRAEKTLAALEKS